jgi:two-component system, cell cycle sensor histidine kinase and response regulator CckA
LDSDRRKLISFRRVYPLLQCLPGFIFLQDLDRHVRFANRCFRERFGDPENTPLNAIIPGTEGIRLDRDAVQNGGGRLLREWEGTLSDGRDYRIFAFPFLEEDGSLLLLVMGIDVTGRRRAEEALRETEASLASFLRSAPMMMGIVEIVGDDILHLSGNAVAGDFFGVPPGVMRNRLASTMGISRADLREWIARYRKAEATGRPHRFEFMHDGPSGRRWLSAAVSFICRSAEGRARFSYVIEDVTERMRVGAELRDRTEMLQAIFHASPVAIEVVDRVGNIRMWNPAAERTFGWTEEEVLGQFQPGATSEDRAAFLSLLERVLQGETLSGVEVQRRRRDGAIVDVRISLAPLHGQGNTIYGSMAVFEDITERKRAELELDQYRRRLEVMVAERTAALTDLNKKLLKEIEDRRRAEDELRRSEEQYRSIVETATEGIWVVGHDNRTVFINQVMADMLGYTPAEVIGEFPLAFVHEEDKTRLAGMYESHRRGRKNRLDLRIRRRSGNDLWVILSTTPFFDKNGRYAGGLGMITDITDRRSLEEQLRHAQRLEAVGRLAGGIAHEFNNMMTVVTGYGELLLGRLGAGDSMRLEIEQIKRAGDRAAALTRQLLAFSRKQVLQPRELDLNAVVLHMDKMLRRLIGEDVALVTVPAEGLWTVKADPGQLEQVIVNLAVNARDAMPEGGRLLIETANIVLDQEYAAHRPEAAPGPYVLLAMADTGVGMDEETRAHLFEPFYTTKGPGKGTGLGLATVYGIVAQSGGHIAVESEPGRGTTFRIYLPRAGGMPREVEEAEAEAPRGRETVLVVEDEEAVRRLVREVLLAQGYRVLEAPGGAEALRLCGEGAEPVDLVLTDVVMPGMSGRELAARLREAVPDIRILFMSGHTETAVLAEGTLRSPREAFLQKPFPQNALARKIRELLDGTDGGRPSSFAPAVGRARPA